MKRCSPRHEGRRRHARRVPFGGACDAVARDGGFSLVEVIVAISVFAILATGVATTVGGGLDLARTNRNRDVAANLASQEMDRIRSMPFASLVVGQTVSTETVQGVAYTVTRDATWVASNATVGACDSAGGIPSLLRVDVLLRWASMGTITPVKSSTVLSPPVGAYDAETGHIAVKVRDRNALPASGIPVTISPAPPVPRPATITTTTDGCAFFDHLPADTYSVSVNSSGWVDRQSIVGPVQSAGVLTGATVAVGFDYDQAAALAVTIEPAGGGVVPSDIPVSVGNTALLPNGIKVYAGTGATRTIANLFPAADGYDLWAGSCFDADPAANDGVSEVWPGGQRTVKGETDPLATGIVTLPISSVSVLVTEPDPLPGPPVPPPLPVVGATVIATHAPDAECPSGQTFTLGVTDATGSIVAGLPYGEWQIEVVGNPTPLSGWPTATLDPTGATVVSATVDLS